LDDYNYTRPSRVWQVVGRVKPASANEEKKTEHKKRGACGGGEEQEKKKMSTTAQSDFVQVGGFLHKEGGAHGGWKNWKKRWFANSPEEPLVLCYYAQKGRPSSKKVTASMTTFPLTV